MNAGGRGEKAAMYDQGDQEDQEIARAQSNAEEPEDKEEEEDDAAPFSRLQTASPEPGMLTKFSNNTHNRPSFHPSTDVMPDR